MRHQRKRHRLGRGASHRKATLAALSTALITHKRIKTTLSKAKALRSYVEPLINRAKEDNQHNRRQVFRRLQDNHAVSELFDEVAGKVGDRPGGYTRVIKLGQRHGDAAELAMVELVDYNDVRPGGEAGSGGRRRRTRRGGGGGGRRRTRSSVKTATQRTGGHGVAEETVEEPVAEEQTVPVPERTEARAEAADVAEEVAAEKAATDEAPEAAAEEAEVEQASVADEATETAQDETPAAEEEPKAAAAEANVAEEAEPEAAEESAPEKAAPEASAEDEQADEEASDEDEKKDA